MTETSTDQASVLERVGREIETLHEFFVEWFSGACAKDEALFEKRVTQRMTPDFELIAPGGNRSDRDAICAAILAAHGTNSAFRISIRSLRVRAEAPGLVLACYEEWQRGASYSSPPNNGRLSSAVFRVEGGELRWVHVHETWLPVEIMAADPFDF